MVTMDSLWETTIALSNGVIADPLRPHLPQKWGVPYAPIYANGHISATGDPIQFMFGSRVGVLGDGGSNGAIYGSNKSKMAAAAIFEKFQMAISRNRSSDPFHVLF